MDALFGRRPISLKSVTDFSHLEKRVQEHLKKVYAALAISMIAACAGAYVHLFTTFLRHGLMMGLVSIGLLLALGLTPHSNENVGKRMAMLLGFSFFTGLGLGPLMDMVIRINPEIVSTAFLGTGVIFVCFSMAALLTHKRTFLFMGGILMSGLSLCLMLSLANIFMRSQLLFSAELYLGFAVMCGMVLYDTQLIVEKSRAGDTDFIWHCVDLFLDFINIFRRLMIILAQKEDKKKNRN